MRDGVSAVTVSRPYGKTCVTAVSGVTVSRPYGKMCVTAVSGVTVNRPYGKTCVTAVSGVTVSRPSLQQETRPSWRSCYLCYPCNLTVTVLPVLPDCH